MKIFQLFSNESEKKFAEQLVERLTKELPPRLMAEHHKVLTVNKITRLLERTGQLAVTYHTEHQLGFLKRAVLANQYKWALKNAGYADDFTDLATESLVVALSKAGKSGNAKA